MNSYLAMPEELNVDLTPEETKLSESVCIAANTAKDKNGLCLWPLLKVQFIPCFTKSLLEELRKSGYELTRNGVIL